MSQKQSVTFGVPAGEVETVVAEIHKHFPHALIGCKAVNGESVLLAVTLYAEEAERMVKQLSTLGGDQLEFGSHRPSTPSMSDLIAVIQQKQSLDNP